MRLMLIAPPMTILKPHEDFGRPAMYEPLGLGYLAASVREAGHEVQVLDCVAADWRRQAEWDGYLRIGLSDADIAERLRAFEPDVVGVTFQFTGFHNDARRVAALTRETLPSAIIVAGGADASARSKEFSEFAEVDLVLRGEGETPLLALLDRLAQGGKPPKDLPGTTVRGVDNPAAEELPDLNAVPFPARDLLPMEVYLEDQRPLMPFAKRFPLAFLVSSRGCPYDCVFCSTTKVWRRWRARSPENVVDEMGHLVQTYGARELVFQDDSFLVDGDRVKRICEEILRREMDITWSVPPGVKANRLTGDLLPVMKASGFYRACFPIEAGDPEMLEYIRKPLDLSEAEEAIERCHAHGIWTYGNFIIGFPRQTPESVAKTAEYAVHCPLDMISVYIAQPYAGSDMYDEFCEMGLLDDERKAGSTVFGSLYDTEFFKAEELERIRADIHKRFMVQRLKRQFTSKGMADLLRKMDTFENARYAARLGYKVAWSVFDNGRVNMFRTKRRKDEAYQVNKAPGGKEQ